MAKSTEAQWIPSGGVLAVAIVAALAAVILVNLYVSYARSAYEDGSAEFYQVVQKIKAGEAIQMGNLRAVRIPKPLVPSFAQAVKVEASGNTMVAGKKLRRDLEPGEFLFYTDYELGTGAKPKVEVLPGMALITIPVDTRSLPGDILQPGTYVTFKGLFNYGTDRDPQLYNLIVLKGVQVKALGGSTEPILKSQGRSYDNVQILVPEGQALHIADAVNATRDGKFSIFMAPTPEVNAKPPEINLDVMKFVAAKQKGSVKTVATPTAPTKVGGGGSDVILPPPPDADLEPH
jgi:hypothetical protein